MLNKYAGAWQVLKPGLFMVNYIVKLVSSTPRLKGLKKINLRSQGLAFYYRSIILFYDSIL